MKYLKPITTLAKEILDLFRQVDDWFIQANTRLYQAKVINRGGYWDIFVYDREGNPVEGAVIMVYAREPGTGEELKGAAPVYVGGCPPCFTPMYHHPLGSGVVNTFVLVTTKAGARLKILNNPRAQLKVCVLGVEQGE